MPITSKELWKNEEKQNYGLIGELHQDLEKEEQLSLNQNQMGRVSYGDKKTAFKTDKGKKLATKLQGLYAVMDQIKAQDTFVTADMIPKEMQKECKKKYGISSKDLERLVGDMQQGNTPDFLVRNEDAQSDFTIQSEQGRLTEHKNVQDALTEVYENSPDLMLRGKETALKTAQALNRPLADAVMEETDHIQGNRVIVKLQQSSRLETKINTEIRDTSFAKKIEQDEKKKGLAQEMKALLATKFADPAMRTYQAPQLDDAQVAKWKKTYGLSRKDQEKLFKQIHAEQGLIDRSNREETPEEAQKKEAELKREVQRRNLNLSLENAENTLAQRQNSRRNAVTQQLRNKKDVLLAKKEKIAEGPKPDPLIQHNVQQAEEALLRKARVFRYENTPVSKLDANQITQLLAYYKHQKSSKQKEAQIKKLQTELTEKEKRQESLAQTLNDKTQEQAALQAQKESLALEIAELEKQKPAEAEPTVQKTGGIGLRFITPPTALSGKKAMQTRCESSLESVGASITKTQAEIDTLKAEITKLQTRLKEERDSHDKTGAAVKTAWAKAQENSTELKALTDDEIRKIFSDEPKDLIAACTNYTAQKKYLDTERKRAAKEFKALTREDLDTPLAEIDRQMKEALAPLAEVEEKENEQFRFWAESKRIALNISQQYDSRQSLNVDSSAFFKEKENALAAARRKHEQEKYPERQDKLQARIAQTQEQSRAIMSGLLKEETKTDEDKAHVQHMKALYTGLSGLSAKELASKNHIDELEAGKLSSQILMTDPKYTQQERARRKKETDLRTERHLTDIRFHHFSYLPEKVAENPKELVKHHDSLSQVNRLNNIMKTRLPKAMLNAYKELTKEYLVDKEIDMEDGRKFTLSEFRTLASDIKDGKLKDLSTLPTAVAQLETLAKKFNFPLPWKEEQKKEEEQKKKDTLTVEDIGMISSRFSTTKQKDDPDYPKDVAQILAPFRTELKLLDAAHADMENMLQKNEDLLQPCLTLEERMDLYPRLKLLQDKASAVIPRLNVFATSALCSFLSEKEQKKLTQYKEYFEKINFFVDKNQRIIDRIGAGNGLPGLDEELLRFTMTSFWDFSISDK